MRNLGWLSLALLGIAFFVVMNSFYVVRQDQQALVLQFGDPVVTRNAPGETNAEKGAGVYSRVHVLTQGALLDGKKTH